MFVPSQHGDPILGPLRPMLPPPLPYPLPYLSSAATRSSAHCAPVLASLASDEAAEAAALAASASFLAATSWAVREVTSRIRGSSVVDLTSSTSLHVAPLVLEPAAVLAAGAGGFRAVAEAALRAEF